MKSEGKLMSMLTGYAAAHQHPFNIFVHMIGIPTIMLGVLIPLTWVGFEINAMHFYLAHVVLAGFFLFYLTLDVIFTVVELFKLAGLRDDLFNAVREQIEEQRVARSAS